MFLHTALSRIEKVAGQLPGKGWGASTTKREIAQIVKHIPFPKTALDVGETWVSGPSACCNRFRQRLCLSLNLLRRT
jgi:hypothetical protein